MQKPIYKTFYKQQEKYWSKFRDQYLEDHIDAYIGQGIEQFPEEVLKEIRTKANTHFANFVTKKINEFIKECKDEGEIWIKTAYPHNRSWIVNDAGIQKTMKRYAKLLDMIHFIDGEGKHDESISVKGWTTYSVETRSGPEERKYSHVVVGSDFYRRAEQTLGIKKITMQKYLQAFTRIGILKRIKQLKTHDRAMLYVDGYFRHVGEIGVMKKERFLNQKDHQRALRNFEY